MKIKLITALVAATIGLTACGGGGDSTPVANAPAPTPVAPAPTPVANTDFDVTVADGYVGGATVWLDLNDDGKQDTNEPSAKTALDGTATLSLPAGTDTAHPVVVSIPVGATDSDQPNGVFAKAVTLKAPAGKAFISPITTMIQNEVEQGNNIETATSIIQESLNTPDSVSLFDDFIAVKTDADTSEADKAEFASLHRVARVATTAMATAFDAGNTAAPEADPKALLQLVMADLKAQLAAIVEKIEAYENDTSKALADFTVADIAVTTFNTTSLVADLEKKVVENTAEKSTADAISATLAEGFFMADYRFDEYDVFKYADGKASDTSYEYNSSTLGWDVESKSEDGGEYFLGADGWKSESTENETLTINSDGSVSWKNYGQESTDVVSTVDLTGKSIKDHGPEDFDSALSASTATFPAGSKAFKIVSTPVSDMYELWNQTNGGHACDYYNGSPLYADSFGGSCNLIPNVSDTVTTGNRATSIAEMLYPTGFVLSLDNSQGTLWMNTNDDSSLFVIALKGANSSITSGTTEFYRSVNGASPTKIATGTWATKDVHGKTIFIPSAVPTAVKQYLEEPNKLNIFAVHNGFVRVGELSAKGVSVVESNFQDFNKTAFDAVLEAYTYPE